MLPNPGTSKDLLRIIGDRMISVQLLNDLSKLFHDNRNDAFSAGYKAGEEFTYKNIACYCEELAKCK